MVRYYRNCVHVFGIADAHILGCVYFKRTISTRPEIRTVGRTYFTSLTAVKPTESDVARQVEGWFKEPSQAYENHQQFQTPTHARQSHPTGIP